MNNSPEYLSFKRNVAMQRRAVDSNPDVFWRYYDHGPRDVKSPLLFLPQVGGTAETFFKQIVTLGTLGYRVLAVDYPPYYTHEAFCEGLTRFIDSLGLEKIHIFGVALGGFLAQIFARYRGRRVESMILCNSFSDSTPFYQDPPFYGAYSWVPEFALKHRLLTNLPQGDLLPNIADSIDFVVLQIDSMDHATLASRMSLNSERAVIDAPPITVDHVTIIGTMDEVAISAALRNQLRCVYQGARFAEILTGGNFPHLAVSDDVNMFIKIHARTFAGTPSCPYIEIKRDEAAEAKP